MSIARYGVGAFVIIYNSFSMGNTIAAPLYKRWSKRNQITKEG